MKNIVPGEVITFSKWPETTIRRVKEIWKPPSKLTKYLLSLAFDHIALKLNEERVRLTILLEWKRESNGSYKIFLFFIAASDHRLEFPLLKESLKMAVSVQ